MENTKQKPKRKPAWGRIIVTLVMIVLLGAGVTKGLMIFRAYHDNIEVEEPSRADYPVRGLDVSRYQGTIDWEVLASQDVTFAFIKATEGSSHQDPRFAENWENSRKSGIYVGAYHFFSYDSSGETQARNYIDTVGMTEGTLPPVVDLEFYGDYYDAPPDKQETRKTLNALLMALETHYGKKPIIYTTPRAYYSYILGGGYGEYPLWIRDVHVKPVVNWTFWQYSDQGMLEGYDGRQADQTEMFIDLNVYRGTMEGFLREFRLPARKQGD